MTAASSAAVPEVSVKAESGNSDTSPSATSSEVDCVTPSPSTVSAEDDSVITSPSASSEAVSAAILLSAGSSKDISSAAAPVLPASSAPKADTDRLPIASVPASITATILLVNCLIFLIPVLLLLLGQNYCESHDNYQNNCLYKKEHVVLTESSDLVKSTCTLIFVFHIVRRHPGILNTTQNLLVVLSLVRKLL